MRPWLKTVQGLMCPLSQLLPLNQPKHSLPPQLEAQSNLSRLHVRNTSYPVTCVINLELLLDLSEVEQRVLTAYCGALLDSEDKAKAMERAVQAYMSAGGKGDPAPAVKEAQAEIAASASYLKVSCLL